MSEVHLALKGVHRHYGEGEAIVPNWHSGARPTG